MLVTYSKKWPWGEPTGFKVALTKGLKPTTIRRLSKGGKRRFHPGDRLHFWMGTPRAPKSSPRAFSLPLFAANYWEVVNGEVANGIYDLDEMNVLFPMAHKLPHKVAVPVVYATEDIEVLHSDIGGRHVIVGGRELNKHEVADLARMDGFGINAPDDNVMVHWFWCFFAAHPGQSFKGQIVHWTTGKLITPKTARCLEYGMAEV